MIGLMDCNNFFVSCERLFRPDLHKKPVLVLSSNDGCVISRSSEVKDMGIPMGVPFFQIKDICKKQGITVFSSNFELYRDTSNRVMTVLKDMYPDRVIYSIDEAFFTIEDANITQNAVQVREKIMQQTGIPVSIGIAPSKTLAKAANTIAKRGNGICLYTPELHKEKVETMSCGSIWGIGRKTTKFLTDRGILTVGDFLAQNIGLVRAILGVHGERLWFELQGISTESLEYSEKNQESYTSTRSFGKKVQKKEVLLSALSYHAERLAEKMRKDGVKASVVTIVLRPSKHAFSGYQKGSTTYVLEEGTHSTMELLKIIRQLLESVFDVEVQYAKAGVILSGITPASWETHTLFASESGKNKDVPDTLVDIINEGSKERKLSYTVVLGREKWQELQQFVSPRYTTHWSEILSVKA